MRYSDEEIYIAVIASAVMMTLLSLVIVIAIVKYQNRRRRYGQEIQELKSTYEQEILKAELEVKEQTLHVVSLEIHDNIGQILSLVKLNLSKMKAEQDIGLAGRIVSTKELVTKAIQDLRNLSKSLNTEYVSTQLLSESLRMELHQIEKAGTLTTSLEVTGSERSLDPQHQVIIFRVAQEALHNILKHAEATHVWIILNFTSNYLTLKIQDDGIGFNATPVLENRMASSGTGVRNMFYRSRLMGGKFILDTQPGHGTLYQLTVPI